jgi:hypothetical protein
MQALLTSSGRFDLLYTTLNSLYRDQKYKFYTTIYDDGLLKIGQHNSIEGFILPKHDKYYLHLEDDWIFNNSYDWISESIKIMEADEKIIKVICREDISHPVEFKDGYGILKYWIDPWKNNEWFGFGWNPGVTRCDLLKNFIPFPKWEQELSKQIYEAGYKVAALERGVCRHIGQGRSTHAN